MKSPKALTGEDGSEATGFRNSHSHRDGVADGLEPLEPLDLARCKSFSDLLSQMSRTAFGGRSLGEAADVLTTMIKDKDCFVVATVSGAMTVAKMGLVLCDMIDHGMVQAIVTTGALMAHGFVEATGRTHFKHRAGMDDRTLYLGGYDRVYDTLELEKNLDDIEVMMAQVLQDLPHDRPTCSYEMMARLGEYLGGATEGRAILKSAREKGVPVYIPAFTDSELGLDFAIYNRRRVREGNPPLGFDPFGDLEHYTELIRRQKRLGIFTIGGGVPRNWAQQVGPYLDILGKRLKETEAPKRFQYGVRICPESVHWGGLSGCTYSEGVSWGKFVPREEGGLWAEVHADATLVWPLLVKGVLERLDNR